MEHWDVADCEVSKILWGTEAIKTPSKECRFPSCLCHDPSFPLGGLFLVIPYFPCRSPPTLRCSRSQDFADCSIPSVGAALVSFPLFISLISFLEQGQSRLPEISAQHPKGFSSLGAQGNPRLCCPPEIPAQGAGSALSF